MCSRPAHAVGSDKRCPMSRRAGHSPGSEGAKPQAPQSPTMLEVQRRGGGRDPCSQLQRTRSTPSPEGSGGDSWCMNSRRKLTLKPPAVGKTRGRAFPTAMPLPSVCPTAKVSPGTELFLVLAKWDVTRGVASVKSIRRSPGSKVKAPPRSEGLYDDDGRQRMSQLVTALD